MKEIYELFDSRIKKNKSALKKYAKSKGYKYYSECVFEELEKKSALKLRSDMILNGVKNPTTESNLFGLKYRIEKFINKEITITLEKKQCWTDGCENKIADGNHAYCIACDNKHKKTANGYEILDIQSGVNQYLF